MRIIVRTIRKIKNEIIKFINRKLNPPKWHNLRSLTPISNIFGLDRGKPIDRIYCEDFLDQNKEFINGVVCEIAENTYTKKFGCNVIKSEILHFNSTNPNATLIADLTKHNTLPKNYLDCFICTVTLNFIYDYKAAIEGIWLMLKDSNEGNRGGGVALVTVASLIQISKYDYDRWGDYWRFNDMGIKKDFEKFFKNVEVKTYGNVLSAISELQGIASEELTKEELFYHDPLYPVLVCIKAEK